MPQLSAAALTESLACFLVPTKSTTPPRATTSFAKPAASFSFSLVFSKSKIWMLFRWPYMNGFTLGFQRELLWPKWTPACNKSINDKSFILYINLDNLKAVCRRLWRLFDPQLIRFFLVLSDIPVISTIVFRLTGEQSRLYYGIS